ncbi:ornithine carbamoyltransferase [uncultured Oscillibacter sp.]|jgi:ornithine carbamoyltransferase|uniref:ornithine carbamoyltransferase n=1 Tax=uncultured Oscillibacter sp. TaxID=876091 RepID=UPI0025D8E027|nr:ornithine carbamoyltransferase [uncultured Oscillibacter sp.]
MAVNLKGRSFLTLQDFTPAEIRYLLDLGHDLKAKRRAGICDPALKGKHIVLLFEKTSTRTRCSFEVAATQEGAHVTYLDAGSSQMGKKESLEDSAKVLGRFFDGIEYRGYAQKNVEELAKYAGVPVWNGLTDADHPTQILADMMTIEEHCHKPLNQIKIVFPGDVRNNMCYAWMIGAAKMGMHFVGIGPEKLAKEMDQEVVKTTFATARENGALLEITDNMNDVKDADVIYGDIWASMGEEALIPERAELLSPFRVTEETLKATGNPNVLYMHCLPSFHDFETKLAKEWKDKGVDIREVTDEVFRGRHSVVFDEAENRMHSIKAVLVATIGK